MSTDRDAEVARICQEALDRAPADRSRYVVDACRGDDELRCEVEGLLAYDQSADRFLPLTAFEMEAHQIASADDDSQHALVGQMLSHYRIVSRLAAGGMGVVYKALDTRLGRPVALKLIAAHAEADADSHRRFAREARAASALNHPNIVAVHDIDEANGMSFLVMELADGQPLRDATSAGALPLRRALDYAIQIAGALEIAHAAGIVHRDIKPANIMVSESGRVKILDFGLAKHSDVVGSADGVTADAAISVTATGMLVGTVAYMSPEQAHGLPVDARSDVFSFGAVLYEMLSGARAFEGRTPLATLTAVANAAPTPLAARRAELPLDLLRLVDACLAKRAESRPTAHEVFVTLEAIRDRLAHEPAIARARKTWRFVAAILVIVALAAMAIAWSMRKASARVSWARAVALPEIQRLADADDNAAAFRLGQQALAILPDDPTLTKLMANVTTVVTVTTDPPGAEVAINGYRATNADWYALGRSPVTARVPFGMIRYRVSKPGYQSIEVAAHGPEQQFRLDPPGSIPSGMVRARGGTFQLHALTAALQDYWIDRYEVTNRAFKAFVDAGGYRTASLWRRFEDDQGHTVPWSAAMTRFRDTTGRPGPATWELGTYPEGQADFPVAGVSWYEADAYATFVGKHLPTVYHWYNAAGLGVFDDMIRASNVASTGAAPVGRYAGLGPFGTYDMAGNVKEWAENAHGDARYILGGAWNEPGYMFTTDETASPFDRRSNYGFRCVTYIDPPAITLLAGVDSVIRDRSGDKPVDDAMFAAFRRLYRYDPTPLELASEPSEETAAWTKETVSFNTAYGKERMRALLFLPKNSSPPYQLVAYLPQGDAFMLRSSRDMRLHWIDFIVRSGRALLVPVYLGAFERGPLADTGPNGRRDLVVAWSKDLGRSLDYAETRTDLDHRRVALYSVSHADGAVLAAVEPRVATVILQSTGLTSVGPPEAPEIDNLNFAPRLRVPTLLLNGRRDIDNPVERSQEALFRLLGAPTADKRHVVFDSGHVIPLQSAVGEILDWLERYLGPVTTR